MSAHGSTLLTATLALLHTWQPLLLHSAAGCMIASVDTSSPKATCPPQSGRPPRPPRLHHSLATRPSDVMCVMLGGSAATFPPTIYHLPCNNNGCRSPACIASATHTGASQPASPPAARGLGSGPPMYVLSLLGPQAVSSLAVSVIRSLSTRSETLFLAWSCARVRAWRERLHTPSSCQSTLLLCCPFSSSTYPVLGRLLVIL